MPAFTFEKISPPERRQSSASEAPTVRRGALIRFLDRLTSARLQKSEDGIRKAQRMKKVRKKK
jgi:hypothetical protein